MTLSLHPWHTVAYTAYLWRQVVVGAVRIARTDLRRQLDVSPAILELPLHCRSDIEITVMASSITITPGTITVGIAPATGPAPATLYVHALYGHDPEEVIASLRDMEHRLLLMTRGRRAEE